VRGARDSSSCRSNRRRSAPACDGRTARVGFREEARSPYLLRMTALFFGRRMDGAGKRGVAARPLPSRPGIPTGGSMDLWGTNRSRTRGSNRKRLARQAEPSRRLDCSGPPSQADPEGVERRRSLPFGSAPERPWWAWGDAGSAIGSRGRPVRRRRPIAVTELLAEKPHRPPRAERGRPQGVGRMLRDSGTYTEPRSCRFTDMGVAAPVPGRRPPVFAPVARSRAASVDGLLQGPLCSSIGRTRRRRSVEPLEDGVHPRRHRRFPA